MIIKIFHKENPASPIFKPILTKEAKSLVALMLRKYIAQAYTF
ncbi:hypothetical protein HMPREF0322_03650 [Desulfitobacterium hafniense DP7]|uniref:Uncharacterized protein n=1 Tax=Desulfitobacterium hafniense DP7 TaxID=537010 RepID=G9XRQ2_DESHA|nr:hypothetical protein HMPREF0322_03650 [Desulfitobacterium hafniense DP7]